MHTQFLLVRTDVVLEPVVADAFTGEGSHRSSLFACGVVSQLHIEANVRIALLLYLNVSSHACTGLEVSYLFLRDVVPNEVLTISGEGYLTELLGSFLSYVVVEGVLREFTAGLNEFPSIGFEFSLSLEFSSEVNYLSFVLISGIFLVVASELELVLAGEFLDHCILLRDVYSEETKGCHFVLTLNEGYTNSSRLTNVNERLLLVVLRLDETRLAVEREGFERLVVSIRLHEVVFVVETILREAAHSFSGVLIHSDGRTILLNTVGTYLLSDGQRIAFVVDIPTGSRAVLVYTGNKLLVEIKELELRELVRVDRVVSRSDDTRSFTGSLVLESSGSYLLINIDILRSALDIQDELKETVFNRSLLHRDHSSAVRSAVSAIDGEVSEVSSSRIDLSTCGVEVVNRLSVTAGELGSSSLRGVHLVVNDTVHELVHRPSVVGELVAFDGFDTAIVAIGDEFETYEEVVLKEVQTLIDLGDLVLERIHLSIDESLNFILRGTFSEIFLYFSKIDLYLIKSSLKIRDLRRVLADSGLVVSSSLLVCSYTFFKRGDLIQGCDLLCAEEVLRFNSLQATFEVFDRFFLCIDAIAERLIGLNEFVSLYVESFFNCIRFTLSSINLAEEVSNLIVVFLLVNLAVDERLQRSLSLFELLHFRGER